MQLELKLTASMLSFRGVWINMVTKQMWHFHFNLTLNLHLKPTWFPTQRNMDKCVSLHISIQLHFLVFKKPLSFFVFCVNAIVARQPQTKQSFTLFRIYSNPSVRVERGGFPSFFPSLLPSQQCRYSGTQGVHCFWLTVKQTALAASACICLHS